MCKNGLAYQYSFQAAQDEANSIDKTRRRIDLQLTIATKQSIEKFSSLSLRRSKYAKAVAASVVTAVVFIAVAVVSFGVDLKELFSISQVTFHQ